MVETTGSEAAARFGFDPDAAFPNRDFWCIEDGRLHVVMPPAPEELSDEELALLVPDAVDPNAFPNYVGCCDAEGGAVEHVFAPAGANKAWIEPGAPASPDGDEPAPDVRPLVARWLSRLFGAR